MKTIVSTFNSMMKNPVKSLLTIFTVALGVCVLIFALSFSSIFSSYFQSEIEQGGIVYTVSNAKFNTDGTLEQVRPPQMDLKAPDVLMQEITGIKAATPVMGSPFNTFIVDGKSYRIRTVVGSNASYKDIMDLQMIKGNFFTKEDVDAYSKVAAISESTAITLFGSVDNALDKIIAPPVVVFGNNRNRNERFSTPSFKITGVFKDVNELKRKGYGTGDMIVPYTAGVPGGFNASQAMNFFSSTLIVKVAGNSNAVAQIREVLTRQYGKDLSIEVWEGTTSGPSDIIADTRKSVNMMSIIINLLGFVLLVSGLIGILSIMLVEVLGKTKDISLERALGASSNTILSEFAARSVIISAVSLAAGLIMALLFSKPMTMLVSNVFINFDITQYSGSIIQWQAVLVSTAVTLGLGSLFGILPVFSTLNINIAEGIREV